MNAEKSRKAAHPAECQHCNEYSRIQGDLCDRCREWLRRASQLVRP